MGILQKLLVSLTSLLLSLQGGVDSLLPSVNLAAVESVNISSPLLPQSSVYISVPVQAGDIFTVNKDNCNDSNTGLQALLNTAHYGDTIVIPAGLTCVGNYVLPYKDNSFGTGWIVVESSAVSQLPQNTRISPAQSSLMPKIVSPNSSSALSSAKSAHNYYIIGLEITVAPNLSTINYGLVELGFNSLASAADLPNNITIDRSYIHGGALCHCVRGIGLNGEKEAVINSYVSEFHGIAQDTQAILGYNGPGPYKIFNNYLETAGENVMFGGAVSSLSGTVPSDIYIINNYFYKPLSWRNSVIPSPKVSSTTAVKTDRGGLIGGATYYYRVEAVGRVGYITSAQSDSIEQTVNLGSTDNSVVLNWDAVNNYGSGDDSSIPSQYYIFRTANTPGTTRIWTRYSIPSTGKSSYNFTDIGAAGTEASPSPAKWLVKNLLEFKNAQRVLVDGNILENIWQHGQTGMAVLFTPRTENGKEKWAVVQDVTFTHNIVRHAGGGISGMSMDDYCVNLGYSDECIKSKRILIQNNIFDDINYDKWGGHGWVVLFTSGHDFIFDHNTIQNSVLYGAGSLYIGGTFTNFSVTNNIFSNGITGDSYIGESAISHYAPGTIFASNVIPCKSCTFSYLKLWYPNAQKTNFFLPDYDSIGFVNYNGGDYHLSGSSIYNNAGTDSEDIGADIDSIVSATEHVVDGKVANLLDTQPSPTIPEVPSSTPITPQPDQTSSPSSSGSVSSSGSSSSGSSGGSSQVSSSALIPPPGSSSEAFSSVIIISKNIALGVRGTDVLTLQNFLVKQGLLVSDNVTGYFGYATQAAVQLFQKMKGIVSYGNPNSTGYGAVGPTTRTTINAILRSSTDTSSSVQALLAQIRILQAQVAALILKLQGMR